MTGSEFAAGAAMIKIFQWAWENFRKEIAQSTTGALQKQWKSFQYKSAAQAYAQQMKKRYGQMQLWRMSAPASVEDIFTRVNILEKQSAFRYLPKEQLQKMVSDETAFGESIEKGRDGMAVLREHHRLFILGKPGAGKTTFLKHITLQAVKGEIDAVPIFVTLQDLSDSQQSLMDFIVKQFDLCGFPEARPFIEKLLKAGKAIVLFDGLDEVNTDQGKRGKQIQALKDFSDQYDKSQVVITCRVAATEYNFQGFTYLEMADFDDDQIKTFVRLWFTSNQKTSELFFIEFEKQSGNRLRDLAKNPLLLTLLCIGFEESLHFPNRRSEIYGEALNALLKVRDRGENIERDEIYQNLSLARKKRMFSQIAANAFEKNDYVFEKNRLEKQIVNCLQDLLPDEKTDDIDGEDVLKAIEAQHGIFVEQAKGLFSFAHLSFQEYYTACYFAEAPENGLPRLMNFVGDSRWREVFLLTVEMLDDADAFFELFLAQLAKIVSQNSRLLAFLNETASKVEHMSTQISPFEMREFVFLHILAISRSYWTAMSITHQKNLSYSSFVEASLDALSRRYVVMETPISTINTTLGLLYRFAQILISVSALAHKPTALLRISTGFKRERVIAKTVKDWTSFLVNSNIKFIDGHDMLARLSIPEEDATLLKWELFLSDLLKVFRLNFSAKYYELSENEFDTISEYHYSTKLLFDSLKVACVSNRAAIEDRLLRPAENPSKKLNPT